MANPSSYRPMSPASKQPKERPILFSAEMVRALLDGTKTQTRRIVKPQPTSDAQEAAVINGGVGDGVWCWLTGADMRDVSGVIAEFRCPYGALGDRLWVREAWRKNITTERIFYRADGYSWTQDEMRAAGTNPIFRPSIHMPRAASRITLKITEVRVQRLHEISANDVLAEGVEKRARSAAFPWHAYAKEDYAALWNAINGKGAWDANPWIWVITFRPASKQRGGR